VATAARARSAVRSGAIRTVGPWMDTAARAMRPQNVERRTAIAPDEPPCFVYDCT
jgi:hypothetical protein